MKKPLSDGRYAAYAPNCLPTAWMMVRVESDSDGGRKVVFWNNTTNNLEKMLEDGYDFVPLAPMTPPLIRAMSMAAQLLTSGTSAIGIRYQAMGVLLGLVAQESLEMIGDEYGEALDERGQ